MTASAQSRGLTESFLRPLLVAAMMTCLAAPLVQGVEWLLSVWDGTVFLVFAFLGALEGTLSERHLRRRRITGYAYLGSRAAELLMLLLLLKLTNYIPLGFGQLWAEASGWFRAADTFVTSTDLLTAAVFAPLWIGAILVSRQMNELDAEQTKALPPEDKTSTEYYLWLTQPALAPEREQALNSLGESFLWGGVGLLAASAVVHVFLDETRATILPTILYFTLGIALLSQARYTVTSLGWQAQAIPVQRGIAKRWLLWSLLFLAMVAVVALLLPTRYAMGPVVAIYRLFGIILQVLMFVITLLTYLLALLLSALFPKIRPLDTPTPPQFGPVIPAEPTSTASAAPWLEIVLSALFWLTILLIVGYAAIRFLRDRVGIFATRPATDSNWWDRFWAWLGGLWRQWKSLRQDAQDKLTRRRAAGKAARPQALGLARFFSLGQLTARELVRYFYLSTAKRAAQAGQPRRPGQTPYEYQATLDSRFSDLEPDLSGLTDAFVQARYSPQPISQKDAEEVKPLWQRIKAALRRRRVPL